MNRVELLADRLDAARKWTNNLLADVEAPLWFKCPAAGVGHVAWQVGHLAASQVALVPVRCLGLEPTKYVSDAFRATFGKGSTPVEVHSKYPPLAEIRDTFDRIHSQTLELIRGMAETDLDAPAVGEPHPYFTTKAGAIGIAAMHETFHAGQIALIRRLAGKAPLR